MLFSVIYTIETSSEPDIDQFSPPPLADPDEAWELEYEDLSGRFRHMEGGWPEGKHRRWSAMLPRQEFNRFIRALGLRPDPSLQEGQYGAPGFVGWSAAVVFRRDTGDFRLLALATPCPNLDGEPVFVPHEFTKVYGMVMDYLDADLRATNGLSQIDHDQFHQLVEQGKTPDEAAQALLQSRRAMAEACERLLSKLDTEEGAAALQGMLDDLEANGDVVEGGTTRPRTP